MTATRLILKSEADTAQFAAKMAGVVQPGDVILLEGSIGAGKSAFARALIRELAGTEIEVPSPTFTLVQTYQFGTVEVWHCDLYRLTHVDEVFELGLDAAFETAVCLIEWPDRLGPDLPDTALTLTFTATDAHHLVQFTAPAQWADRIAGCYD